MERKGKGRSTLRTKRSGMPTSKSPASFQSSSVSTRSTTQAERTLNVSGERGTTSRVTASVPKNRNIPETKPKTTAGRHNLPARVYKSRGRSKRIPQPKSKSSQDGAKRQSTVLVAAASDAQQHYHKPFRYKNNGGLGDPEPFGVMRPLMLAKPREDLNLRTPPGKQPSASPSMIIARLTSEKSPNVPASVETPAGLATEGENTPDVSTEPMATKRFCKLILKQCY